MLEIKKKTVIALGEGRSRWNFGCIGAFSARRFTEPSIQVNDSFSRPRKETKRKKSSDEPR
jgi:hypothetical protein